MRALPISLISASALVLTGCLNHQAPLYTPAPDNVSALQGVSAGYNVALVSTAPTDTGEILCRASGPITVGEGKTYASYVVEALNQDLKKAGIYSEKPTPLIQATYTTINFQSDLGRANWYINAVYRIGNESVSVDTVYNDRSSFFGSTACKELSSYFPKAVAAHLNQLYKTKLFRSAQLSGAK